MTLEKRLKRLEKRYLTLYRRTYASHVRRKDIHKRYEFQLKNWVKNFSNFDERFMRQLGILFSALEKGRCIVTVTPRERNLLRAKLSGRCGWGKK